MGNFIFILILIFKNKMTQEQTQILESELLKDPLNDRKVKEVPLPPQVPLNI